MTDERELTAERVAELVRTGAVQVVDVREDYEHRAGHLPGDRHLELSRLTAEAGSLDRDRPVVFYCRSGERSKLAADAFRASGWDARTLSGGLVAWAEHDLPLEPADGRVAPRSGLPGGKA